MNCSMWFADKSVLENYFLYLSSKTYVDGTQKNRLNEMVLLNTYPKRMFKVMDKKIITILRSKRGTCIKRLFWPPYEVKN